MSVSTWTGSPYRRRGLETEEFQTLGTTLSPHRRKPQKKGRDIVYGRYGTKDVTIIYDRTNGRDRCPNDTAGKSLTDAKQVQMLVSAQDWRVSLQYDPQVRRDRYTITE